MPTYDYYCSLCMSSFTRELSIGSRLLPVSESCPLCNGKGGICKTITRTNFIMKGACAANGYSTDIGDIERRLGRQWTNEDNRD